MKILKGKVQDPGFPDTEVTYLKTDDDQTYFFIEDGTLKNGNIIATPVLKEGIGHDKYTSLGLITPEGKILIPFENKNIQPLSKELLLVERNVAVSANVVDAISKQSDPLSASELIETSTTIKDQIKNVMGSNGSYVFDNQFSEAALYTTDGVNLANDYFSFIGMKDGAYYMSKNIVGDSIIKYDPYAVASQENTQESNSVSKDVEENKEQEEQQEENQTVEVEEKTEEVVENQPLIPNIDFVNNNSEENTISEENSSTEESAVSDGNEVSNEDDSSKLKLNISEDDASNEGESNTDTRDNNNLENEEENSISQEDEANKEDNNEENDINEEEINIEESLTNPIIADATNTIKKLLDENKKQQQLIEELTKQNEILKKQVSGIMALKNAVAEANGLFSGEDEVTKEQTFTDDDLGYGYLDEDEGYQYTKKAS